MRRMLMLLGLGVMLALTGCGPAVTYLLCTNQVLDCTNGRDTESAQEAKK